MIEFQQVLEYLRDTHQPSMSLHPGFPPTTQERLAKDTLAILQSMAEQIEANRLAIKELRRELKLVDGRASWGNRGD